VKIETSNLTIIGEDGPPRTVVQAANSGDHVFEIRANDVHLAGFSITGATEWIEGEGAAKGIYVRLSQGATLENNDVYGNIDGITLYSCKDCIVYRNSVFDHSGFGIWVSFGSDNRLEDNSLRNNNTGIYLHSSCGNILSGNDLCDNGYTAISIDDYEGAGSEANVIARNSIEAGRWAISLRRSSNNTFYLNDFSTSPSTHGFVTHESSGISNRWYSPLKLTYVYAGAGYTSHLGNYWSDYTGSDADGDGIGDTSYSINSDSDDYPLISPFENYSLTTNDPPDTHLQEPIVSANTATFTWSGTDDRTPAKNLLYCYRLRKDSSYSDWSTWSGSTTKTYTGLSPANYRFQVRAKDGEGAIDPSPASREFTIGGAGNMAPIARASDISGQPQTVYPDTVYSVTAKYYDPNGRTDLKHCYLRLNHPTKPLTMMWYQADGHAAPWAGEEGENYLTITNVDVTEIVNGSEGYELTWSFQVNDQWPEVENAIDFGVFTSDDGGLESGWDYDDTGASFVLRFFNPELSIPICAPMMQDAHVGTTLTFAFTVQNSGNQTDTINLSFEDQFNWDISLSTSSATLQPGESCTVYLFVTVSDAILNRVTITGTSAGDSSKRSSCMIRVNGYDEVALFMVKATFSNSTTEVRTLHFDIPNYVKISDQAVTLSASTTATVTMLFDPGRQDTRFHGFELKIDDLHSGDRVIINTDFNTDEIIATDFHMSKHSYNFPNFGLWKLTSCFGMSETSILYFEGAIKLPNGVPKTYDLEKNQVKRLIVWYQWRALRSTWDGLMVRLPTAKPSEQYKILEQNIRAGHPMIIAIKNHAVVGYKIVRRGPVSYIRIYDNELPLGTDASLVDTAFPYATYNHETHVFNYTGLDRFLAIEAVKRILDLVVPAVECPVNVTITDQYGRRISNTGTNDIPGADVWMDETGEIKIFYLPSSLNYRARFDAYAEGSFTLTIFLPCTDETAYVSAFNAVSIDEGGNAELTFAAGSPASIMMIDLNNDGITDEMKDPTTAEVDQSELEPIAPVVPPLQTINHGPNPVGSAGTTFFYTLPAGTSTAKLMIFSATGRLVFETPLDVDSTRFPTAGTWNPVDKDGIPLANGPYIYVLIANGKVIGQGKMVIQR